MVCTSCFTYNHAPYIVDAMNGFTMQQTTFPVITCIVDDASTDGEPEVIRQYLTDHFQAPYRVEETDDYQLICANHNTNTYCTFAVFLLKYNHHSIKKSKILYVQELRRSSKYIAICEGDDYWIHPKKLQMQVDYMEENVACVLTHTAFEYREEGIGSKMDAKRITKTNIRLLQLNKDIRPYILDGNAYLVQTMTAMFRTEAGERVAIDLKEYQGKFQMGDTQLWVALISLGKVYFFDEVTSIYRLHRNSATHQPTVADKLRFQLSCSEMRVALAEKYLLSAEYINRFRKQYNWTLTEYLWLNRSYQPFIPPCYDSIKEKIIYGILQSRYVGFFAKRIYLSKKMKVFTSKAMLKMNPFKPREHF